MPLYEYCCRKCGRRIEIIQKFSDAPLTTCEECGGQLEKLMSVPSIRFKGSGWYVNDYGGKKSGGNGASNSHSSRESKDSSDTPAKTSGPSEEKASGNKPKVA